MLVDSHHHLWNLSEVNYPWLMEKGATRFFGDPTPIQRNYLLDEHISKIEPFKFNASVHVQVGAEDAWQEAKWIDQIATNSKNWKIVQVAFCDLAAPDFLDKINKLSKRLLLPPINFIRSLISLSLDIAKSISFLKIQ